jgi:hypothetical protein
MLRRFEQVSRASLISVSAAMIVATCFMTGVSFSGEGVPSKAFFENYMAKKTKTFAEYRQKGIEPYLSITLENNSAFRCITSSGQEVDFESYVATYQYTFDHFVYQEITPAAVAIKPINDDQIEVIYTMRMQGQSRAGSRYDVLRENTYTFTRIDAEDTERLRELKPQNLDKYFKEYEDKWIVTRIEYGF